MFFPYPNDIAEEVRRTGALVQSPQDFGDKVYYCRHGFRHWVRDAAWIHGCGYRWPDDVIKVPSQVLSAFRPGGPVARYFPNQVDPGQISNSLDMREYIASQLQGSGLEIGAGASPFPVPLDCRVQYGDSHTYQELLAGAYPGQAIQDIVIPDIITDLDTLQGVADESLDFIIGCHVIEHTRNPIGAIRNAYRKLRVGGKLVLVIPDKERTFDKARTLTSLAHLLEDFQNPSWDRDFQHYQEFYELAFETPEQHRRDVVMKRFKERYSIHFHVWTYDSFREMLTHICEHVVPWREVWGSPARSNPDADIEFYFVLTK